jgi:WD40 repeat protein
LQILPKILGAAAQADRLHHLLTDLDFIEAKVSAVGPQPLIEDYDLAFKPGILLSENKANSLRLIQAVLRLSAHILTEEKTQLAQQLLGRLLSCEVPRVQLVWEQARQWNALPWLYPLSPNTLPSTGGLPTTLTGSISSVNAVAVTLDGQQKFCASNDALDEALTMWELESGVKLLTQQSYTGRLRMIAVTPDAQQALCASYDGALELWDLERLAVVHTRQARDGWLNAVVTTSSGQRSVSVSENGTFEVWDHERDVVLLTLILTSYPAPVAIVMVTPNDQQAIFTSSENHSLKVWNLKSQAELFTLSGQTQTVSLVAVTLDARWAISGSLDDSLKVWDLERGAELFTLCSRTERVYEVAMTPDGQRAISVSEGGILKVWNLEKGTSMLTLTDHDNTRIGALAITSDGRFALSASLDNNTIKVWDLDRGLKLHTLRGYTEPVTAVEGYCQLQSTLKKLVVR